MGHTMADGGVASEMPVDRFVPTKKRTRNPLTQEARKAKRESDKTRAKTRVNLGRAFSLWREQRELKGLKTDPELAFFLLNRFSTSHQTDGSVDKEYTCAVSRKRKRSPSVHPQDERTPALLNDDVWVNLSCLLQLFQECGRCRGTCTVNTQEDRSHFSVVQYCKACNSWVIWNSQPLKSTSTEKGESKEDIQVQMSLPCDDRQRRQKVTTGSDVKMEMEAWNEEHHVELEVNIDSDFSDELPLCRLEEEGGEEELGQQLDEMHEDDVGQLEKHHKDIKLTEKQVTESVERTVEVNGENDKASVDKATEDDIWQREDEEEEEEDWSEEEEQQEGDSQESDPDFEISKPIKRRPRMRTIFENENEGINKVTEDQEWRMDDDEEEEEEEWSEEEQKEHSWERDPNFKKIKLIKSRHRMRQVFLKRCPQRLCPNCGIMYASQTHVCNDKKKFPCPKCGRLWLSELNVNAHIIHCKGSAFPCRFCLELFKTQLDKLNHERSHRDTEKPFSCSKCPETFGDFFTRNRHLKEHRVLTCQTCQKSFSEVHQLRRHERSHLDDKPFKCQVCERAFAQGSQLKCHMRVHTGERPYNCQLCPMRFNHNVSLKTHIRRYHQSESHLISPQSHPDSGEQPVIPRGPSSAMASEPREQGESSLFPSSDKGLDPIQEPQPSRGSTEPGEVHNMTVQEKGEGEVAESVLEDQGGLTLQTKLEIVEMEGEGNAYESRPKRKHQRNRWLDSDFE